MKGTTFFFLAFAVTWFGCRDSSLTCEELRNDYLTVSSRVVSAEDSIALVRQLERLSLIDTTCTKGRELLSQYYIDANRLDEAFGLLQSNMRRDSNALLSCYYLAEISRLRGDYKLALDYVRRAILMKGSESEVGDYNNLFAVDFDVKRSNLLLTRGMVFFELKTYDSAYVDFSAVLSAGDEEELCRAYIYMIQKEKASANGHLK